MSKLFGALVAPLLAIALAAHAGPVYPPFAPVFGTGAPGTSTPTGQLYFDTSAAPYQGYVYNGTVGAWQSFGSGTPPICTGTVSGDVPAGTGSTATFLRGDCTWVAPPFLSSGAGAFPGFASNRYYPGPVFVSSAVQAGTAMTANTIYSMPFYVPAPTTFGKIAGFCTANTNSASLEFGIYTATGNGPGTLILDAGSFTPTCTSVFSGPTINETLAAGWYYLTVASSAASLQLWDFNCGANAMATLSYTGAPETSPSNTQGYPQMAWTYSAGNLPVTFSTTTTTCQNTPVIWLHL